MPVLVDIEALAARPRAQRAEAPDVNSPGALPPAETLGRRLRARTAVPPPPRSAPMRPQVEPRRSKPEAAPVTPQRRASTRAAAPPRNEAPGERARGRPSKVTPEVPRPHRAARAPTPPAETGRPETAKEFAKRIKRVTLRMPSHGGTLKGEEGAGTAVHSSPDSNVHNNERVPVSSPKGAGLDEKEPPQAQHQAVNVTTERPDAFFEHVARSSDGLDLEGVLKGTYNQDPFFRVILENPSHYKNFSVRNGLIFIKEKGTDLLCIPDTRIGGRSVREVVIKHAHSLLAHLGASKTLDHL
ncbi:hypothetical protein K474DRAFT_1670819 [Panus rudis PR-1116 ss-1]|nr:hypothetical protein K474DRAFT_1670819 [Panus rudis PR-1116 ss-1]